MKLNIVCILMLMLTACSHTQSIYNKKMLKIEQKVEQVSKQLSIVNDKIDKIQSQNCHFAESNNYNGMLCLYFIYEGEIIAIKGINIDTDWKQILLIFNTSWKLFAQFEPTLNCNLELKSVRDILTIYMLPQYILTDSSYFFAAEPTNYGRYFKSNKELFMMYNSKPSYFAKMFAHYFYQMCEIQFDDPEREQDKAYEFSRLYVKYANIIGYN